MFIVQCIVGQVQGFWPLVYHQCWALTKLSIGYPAVVLSHGATAAMVPQGMFLHMFQQVIDG